MAAAEYGMVIALLKDDAMGLAKCEENNRDTVSVLEQVVDV